MSTNYYLVRKGDWDIKKKYEEIVHRHAQALQEELLQFDAEAETFCEDDISQLLQRIENDLNYGIFEIRTIHICKISTGLTWQINEHFSSISEFVDFYERKNEWYDIEDEYGEPIFLEEFLDMIEPMKKSMKYMSEEFF